MQTKLAPLAHACGPYDEAREQLEAKADELGYYLSGLSDADDRGSK